ncbi:MAG: hypothetical protein ABIR79_08720 [Candidatus Binatia bacterium]
MIAARERRARHDELLDGELAEIARGVAVQLVEHLPETGIARGIPREGNGILAVFGFHLEHRQMAANEFGEVRGRRSSA